MNASIEQRVSSALMRWRFVERAVHGVGEWSMTYGGVTVPAAREVSEDGVSFTAEFPPVCILDADPLVYLAEDGETVHLLVLDAPLDECGAVVRHDVTLPAQAIPA